MAVRQSLLKAIHREPSLPRRLRTQIHRIQRQVIPRKALLLLAGQRTQTDRLLSTRQPILRSAEHITNALTGLVRDKVVPSPIITSHLGSTSPSPRPDPLPSPVSSRSAASLPRY